jgi:hypothetical protein
MWWLSGKPEYIIIAAILAGIGFFSIAQSCPHRKRTESKFGKNKQISKKAEKLAEQFF